MLADKVVCWATARKPGLKIFHAICVTILATLKFSFSPNHSIHVWVIYKLATLLVTSFPSLVWGAVWVKIPYMRFGHFLNFGYICISDVQYVYLNLLSYLLWSNTRIYQNAYYGGMHRFTHARFVAHVVYANLGWYQDYWELYQLLSERQSH